MSSDFWWPVQLDTGLTVMSVRNSLSGRGEPELRDAAYD
jgi:hypothetical protein